MNTSIRPRQGGVFTTSVVIPVRNGGDEFSEVLRAINACAPEQLIVVDDGSDDDSVLQAERIADIVVRTPDDQCGPAAARNVGAQHASEDLILFLDSDVLVPSDLIERFVTLFRNAPTIHAAFGSYDTAPRRANFISQYRNLLHHFVHQSADPVASTFWAGCGAIRRSTFNELGGFDGTFRAPSIEDIELGYRAVAAGYHIRLEKGIQVTHLKRWGIWSMVRTDLFQRAIPWTRLILRSQNMVNDLNTDKRARVKVALTGLICCLMPLLWHPVARWLSLGLLLTLLLSDIKLWAFFFRLRGSLFVLAAMPMQFLHYVICGIAFGSVKIASMAGVGSARRLRDPGGCDD